MSAVKLIISVLCIVLILPINGEGTCGLKAPIEGQTCIEIKLPWETTPVYYCKKDHNYRPCPWNYTCYNGQRQGVPMVLEIKAPWMCCKQKSYPDPCAGRKCPDAPFNRTCIQKDRFVGACCKSFYCGDEDNQSKWPICQNMTCKTAPEDQKCITFADQHDCCPKIQCPKDEKKGECPVSKEGEVMPKWVRESFKSRQHRTLQRCTGDYTCHNDEKCCIGYRMSKKVLGYCYQLPNEGENNNVDNNTRKE